jgi:hypothetical protein
MQNNLLLPPNEIPAKKTWKTWKWTVLAAFGLALVFKRWLPGFLVAACYVAGILVIFNLLFHLLRHLKNRVFWRVRHRILGSFIFVGFIPLLVLCGVGYLSIYLLLGQLSVHYLDSSLVELEQEVAGINLGLGHRILPPISDAAFREAAEKDFTAHKGEYKKLAALLMHKRSEDSLERIGSYESRTSPGSGLFPTSASTGTAR